MRVRSGLLSHPAGFVAAQPERDGARPRSQPRDAAECALRQSVTFQMRYGATGVWNCVAGQSCRLLSQRLLPASLR